MNTAEQRKNGDYSKRVKYVSELTVEGWLLCVAAALIEELLVFWRFEIQIMQTPLSVFTFIWLLFLILTAALLTGWDEHSRAYRTAKRNAAQSKGAYVRREGEAQENLPGKTLRRAS